MAKSLMIHFRNASNGISSHFIIDKLLLELLTDLYQMTSICCIIGLLTSVKMSMYNYSRILNFIYRPVNLSVH